MSERLGKIYDIICKLDFFNQRVARELWNGKPIEIQNQDIFNRHQDLCELKEFVDDVAELIKLEEQGLLLKLPCKVGQNVYVVGTRCFANEEPFEYWCDTHDCEECILDKTYTVFEMKISSYMCYVITAGTDKNFIFGKTVFLTKEEAEEARRKLVE